MYLTKINIRYIQFELNNLETNIFFFYFVFKTYFFNNQIDSKVRFLKVIVKSKKTSI